eukprot:TRINITY_DN6048_c0_g3_i1.p2 TRINITY_DN6048_c0_g3~~TRINITY_DN6048_c0_g3_i1.p2  ORF type:complete len:123 (-),score=18.32 TRINITY_DN6048_c0_g3_i1:343-711(-)
MLTIAITYDGKKKHGGLLVAKKPKNGDFVHGGESKRNSKVVKPLGEEIPIYTLHLFDFCCRTLVMEKAYNCYRCGRLWFPTSGEQSKCPNFLHQKCRQFGAKEIPWVNAFCTLQWAINVINS